MKRILAGIVSVSLFLLSTTSVYGEEKVNNPWTKESIYYILIDRFQNANSQNDFDINVNNPDAYHGGDIQGIIEKLDHIQELGFTTINLSPIMANSESGYHGYWTEDLSQVEEHFGTLDDLKALVQEVHDRDMKIVLDFSPWYVSANHPWLDEDDKQEWFLPNRNVATDDTFQRPWLEGLPVLNTDNEQAGEYVLEAAEYWVKETGVDGYRLYVDDEVSRTFIATLTERLKAVDPSFLIMTEVENLTNYPTGYDGTITKELYQSMSNTFQSAGQPLETLYDQWIESSSSIGEQTVPVGLIDSHETVRFTREAVLQKQNPITRWKLALTFLYTTPVIPVVYQGTDIPMDNGVSEPDHRVAQLNGGDEELRAHIEQLNAIRKQFPVLTNGSFEKVASEGAMSLFKRTNGKQTIYIAINNDVSTKVIELEELDSNQQLRGLLLDNIVRQSDQGVHKIALERETADIFLVQEDTGMNWAFISFVILVMAGFIAAVIVLSIRSKKKNQD
ncbi:alpha-amylase [Radiobacillus kanasensis]|uniref:alpha-amylase family glycosyl hydrolase n=1 Tax=Radiobacillus kanasensis TaxID=2844358 RepID=UPI001E5B312E|nr:alpha-amylase family glycosyl hydrolase [Radiobacillus kanasensis]UFU00535.1 alpha-amylase [Radiobacillus kanasensis]